MDEIMNQIGHFYKILPGHGRYFIGKTPDDDYGLMVACGETEVHPGDPFPKGENYVPLTGFNLYSPEQVEGLAKILSSFAQEMRKQEEEEKNFQIGDEVANEQDPAKRFWVTHVAPETISGVARDGGLYKTKPKSSWRKTGNRNEALAKALVFGKEEE